MNNNTSYGYRGRNYQGPRLPAPGRWMAQGTGTPTDNRGRYGGGRRYGRPYHEGREHTGGSRQTITPRDTSGAGATSGRANDTRYPATRSENPDFSALVKNINKYISCRHAETNWQTLPPSINRATDQLIRSIKLPSIYQEGSGETIEWKEAGQAFKDRLVEIGRGEIYSRLTALQCDIVEQNQLDFDRARDIAVRQVWKKLGRRLSKEKMDAYIISINEMKNPPTEMHEPPERSDPIPDPNPGMQTPVEGSEIEGSEEEMEAAGWSPTKRGSKRQRDTPGSNQIQLNNRFSPLENPDKKDETSENTTMDNRKETPTTMKTAPKKGRITSPALQATAEVVPTPTSEQQQGTTTDVGTAPLPTEPLPEDTPHERRTQGTTVETAFTRLLNSQKSSSQKTTLPKLQPNRYIYPESGPKTQWKIKITDVRVTIIADEHFPRGMDLTNLLCSVQIFPDARLRNVVELLKPLKGDEFSTLFIAVGRNNRGQSSGTTLKDVRDIHGVIKAIRMEVGFMEIQADTGYSEKEKATITEINQEMTKRIDPALYIQGLCSFFQFYDKRYRIPDQE